MSNPLFLKKSRAKNLDINKNKIKKQFKLNIFKTN